MIIRDRDSYDDAERLGSRESDGGGFLDVPADGEVDEVNRWTYSRSGDVSGFERDGTADDDGGPMDGEVDESLAFSAGCMELVSWRRGIFRFPN